jgi:hypothetical protein
MKPSRQRAVALALYAARAWLAACGPALAQPVIVPTTTNQIAVAGTVAAASKIASGAADRLRLRNSEE